MKRISPQARPGMAANDAGNGLAPTGAPEGPYTHSLHNDVMLVANDPADLSEPPEPMPLPRRVVPLRDERPGLRLVK